MEPRIRMLPSTWFTTFTLFAGPPLPTDCECTTSASSAGMATDAGALLGDAAGVAVAVDVGAPAVAGGGVLVTVAAGGGVGVGVLVSVPAVCITPMPVEPAASQMQTATSAAPPAAGQ